MKMPGFILGERQSTPFCSTLLERRSCWRFPCCRDAATLPCQVNRCRRPDRIRATIISSPITSKPYSRIAHSTTHSKYRPFVGYTRSRAGLGSPVFVSRIAICRCRPLRRAARPGLHYFSLWTSAAAAIRILLPVRRGRSGRSRAAPRSGFQPKSPAAPPRPVPARRCP
jgi:hypothetical protein